MADFETKLRRLSERGNPVGAGELIERIEAELAGDPLVVVAKRREGTTMTKTQQSPRTDQPDRYRGPAWALATFVAVLTLAATMYYTRAGDNNQVADTMTDLEIIEAGVDALYSGDAERAIELFELPNYDDGFIRRKAAYEAAISGRLTLNCVGGTDGVFTCTTPYHNALTDAIGHVDRGDTFRVVVKDGVIREFHFTEPLFIMVSVALFLNEDNQACGREFFGLFPDEPTQHQPSVDCANLILEHLDEWAANKPVLTGGAG